MKAKVLVLLLTLIALPQWPFAAEDNEDDWVLEGLDPPKDSWYVKEGDCGEACLWTVCNYLSKNLSEEQINAVAGSPGRGVHSDEIITILKKLKIRHNDISEMTSIPSSFLRKKVVGGIKKGNPVLLGFKIYPDEHPEWACDHFVLVVGCNEKNEELIYNSNNSRQRISLEKLLNTDHGYSIISKSKFVFGIQLELGKKKP